VPDEPTLGEVVRRLEDIREDIRDVAGRLDRKVSMDVYEIKHNQLIDRVSKIEAERAREAEAQAAARRAVFQSLLAPIIVTGAVAAVSILLTLYVAFLKGPS
jgi:hypothetical protein